jgi:hypothetical protein
MLTEANGLWVTSFTKINIGRFTGRNIFFKENNKYFISFFYKNAIKYRS